MLPLMMAAQAASVVGICQTLPPQLAVLVALTEVVVVDILVVVDMNVVELRCRFEELGLNRWKKKKNVMG
jgi:hypothetical protein